MVADLPGGEVSQPCAHCGAAVPRSGRYPEYACATCAARAVDASGAPWRAPSGSAAHGTWVWIDKTRWWWQPTRDGGAVIVPALEDRDQVRPEPSDASPWTSSTIIISAKLDDRG